MLFAFERVMSRALLTFNGVTRKIIAGGLYRAGLFPALERLLGTRELHFPSGLRLPRFKRGKGPKFGILCYHRVGTQGAPLFSRLSPDRFKAQMSYLKRHYRVIALGQLCNELQSDAPSSPALAITFDDGYRDLYTFAFSVLRELQFPATVYLIGRCMQSGEVPWYDRIFLALKDVPGTSIELEMDGTQRLDLTSVAARNESAWRIVSYLRTKPDRWRRGWCCSFETRFPVKGDEATGRVLSWDEVREMYRSGISFGAHTMSHPSVRQLTLEDLQSELRESKRLIERELNAEVVDFAYPFGKPEDTSSAAERCLVDCGYRSAVTTSGGANTREASLLRLRRLSVADEWSMADFALNVSRMFMETPPEMNQLPLPANSAASGAMRHEVRG